MLNSVSEYRETLSDIGRTWYDAVVNHMETYYPEYPLVLSYQRPTYRLINKIFLMLGGGKHHFSIYTTDFDYVETLKSKKIKGLTFGKSAVLFQFAFPDHLMLALKMTDEVISRVKTGAIR